MKKNIVVLLGNDECKENIKKQILKMYEDYKFYSLQEPFNHSKILTISQYIDLQSYLHGIKMVNEYIKFINNNKSNYIILDNVELQCEYDALCKEFNVITLLCKGCNEFTTNIRIQDNTYLIDVILDTHRQLSEISYILIPYVPKKKVNKIKSPPVIHAEVFENMALKVVKIHVTDYTGISYTVHVLIKDLELALTQFFKFDNMIFTEDCIYIRTKDVKWTIPYTLLFHNQLGIIPEIEIKNERIFRND